MSLVYTSCDDSDHFAFESILCFQPAYETADGCRMMPEFLGAGEMSWLSLVVLSSYAFGPQNRCKKLRQILPSLLGIIFFHSKIVGIFIFFLVPFCSK